MDRRTERQEIARTQECGAKSRIKLAIVYRRIDELKADPANPRRHSKKQIRQIGNSLKAFDFIVPVLIDRDDNIIAGHGRVLAGREVGITEVPTLCLDHLTATQARAFMIADNRLTEIATWDDRLLAQQLKELSLKHVTLTMLWDEYIERCPEGYRYSRFCELYRGWASRLSVTLLCAHD